MIAGYLDPCPRAAVHVNANLRDDVVDASPDQTFDLPWCLVAHGAAGAVRHGLTLTCLGDWDCPSGSTCDVFPDPLGPTPPGAVCRPGARGAALFERLRP